MSPPPGFSAGAKRTSPTSHQEEPMRVEPFQTGLSYDPKPPKQPGQTRVTGLVSTSRSSSTGRQKQKYVPLLSAEGQSRATMQLPGRHACHCLAQKHALVNNCIECGRIVCAQVCICVCVCNTTQEKVAVNSDKASVVIDIQ